MSKPKTQECPRAAMLRVRSFVKQFMSGKKANKFTDLSKYPQNVADRNRTIIALQDMLEDRIVKHNKASDLIENFKQNLTTTCNDFSQHILYLHRKVNNLKDKVADNKQTIINLSDDNNVLRKSERAREQDIHEMQFIIDKLRHEIANMSKDQTALLTTVKISLGSKTIAVPGPTGMTGAQGRDGGSYCG